MMSNNLPLVTVCMPTYNHELYIEQAIMSVIKQDYANIQLIISDDCSTDNTAKIAHVYKSKYENIIDLQVHANNLGIEGNIESIYPLIKGQYVCWFSGDDVYYEYKISTQIYFMLSNPNCIFSFHDVDVVNDAGKFLYKFNDKNFGVKLYKNDIAKNLLRERCFICCNSIMINNVLAQNIKHKIGMGIAADWLLLFELAAKDDVMHISQTLGLYRRHSNNISKKINISSEEKIYNYLLSRYPAYKKDIYIGISKLYSVYLFKYLMKRQFNMAVYCISKVFKLLILYPVVFFSIFQKIFSEITSRIKLLLVFKTISR